MILLRCLLCPTWRRMGYNNLVKPIIRNETTTTSTTTSVFSNIQKSLSNNVLVFEYKDRILPVLGVLGFIQFIAFDLIAYWSFYLFGTVTAKQENLTSESTLLDRAATIVPTKKFRYTTNAIIVLLNIRMILLRCLLCPTWRRMGYNNLVKPIIRNETTTTSTTTSAFSNIQKSLSNNVLVFEYKDRILPVLGVLGFIQFIAFDLIAYWSFYLFGTVTAKQENLTSESTLLDRAATIVPTKKFRYTTNAIIVLLSGAIFGACIIYPARCIRRLYLLKDGSSVGVVTYALWPNARKFTVPLENVSAQTGLKGVGVFHKLSLKDRWLSHLVNNREGKFYNKTIYETVIALKRF
ncbi:unnamed protein product [Adineta steineri]|uniref:Uncharacterized protein n=2 Tax=Adineta steineri TaxID=433720 RepID=A0A815BBB9_9BILA|nr:unnamed protein product [Adineta steineri]